MASHVPGTSPAQPEVTLHRNWELRPGVLLGGYLSAGTQKAAQISGCSPQGLELMKR